MFNWTAFLAVVLTASLSPGPNNIMCMVLGQNLGLKKTFKYIFGIAIGYFLLITTLGLFNQYIFTNFPKITVAFKFLGVTYLFYLAGNILYGSFGNARVKKQPAIIEENKLFVTAMFFQFVNPKAILFGLSIFSAYIIPFYQDKPMIMFFACFLTMVTFCSTSFWASFGALLHNFIKNHEKVFNSVMALLLIYSAYTII